MKERMGGGGGIFNFVIVTGIQKNVVFLFNSITLWVLDFSHFMLHVMTILFTYPTQVIVCTCDTFKATAIHRASAGITRNSWM